jgi:hypothetical protein
MHESLISKAFIEFPYHPHQMRSEQIGNAAGNSAGNRKAYFSRFEFVCIEVIDGLERARTVVLFVARVFALAISYFELDHSAAPLGKAGGTSLGRWIADCVPPVVVLPALQLLDAPVPEIGA